MYLQYRHFFVRFCGPHPGSVPGLYGSCRPLLGQLAGMLLPAGQAT